MNQITSWFSAVSKQLDISADFECKKNVNDNLQSSPADTSIQELDGGGAKNQSDDCIGSQKNAASDSTNFLELVNPKSYANMLVNSVGSLTDKISRTKPEDLKNFFDNKLHMLHELDHENRKFVEELKADKARGSSAPVWKGCQDETSVRKQALLLSLESRNFLSDPPADQSDFHFDYASSVSLAMTMLNEDPNLRKMRFQLVPKFIAEERFWRNYFYRISLIKQSVALKSMAKTEEAAESELCAEERVRTSASYSHENAVSPSFDTVTPTNVEFLSDTNQQPDALDPVLMAARQELGILSAEGSPTLERKARENGESTKDWESDILSELNDEEFISKLSEKSPIESDVKNDASWEDEISELLQVDK